MAPIDRYEFKCLIVCSMIILHFDILPYVLFAQRERVLTRAQHLHILGLPTKQLHEACNYLSQGQFFPLNENCQHRSWIQDNRLVEKQYFRVRLQSTECSWDGNGGVHYRIPTGAPPQVGKFGGACRRYIPLRQEVKAKGLVKHFTRQCLAKKLCSQKHSTKLLLHCVLLLKLSRD